MFPSGQQQQHSQASLQAQINELQKKFRCAEKAKRLHGEDSQAKIRKQRATIEKITRENKKMKAELADARGAQGSHAENKMAMKTMGQLTEQKERLLDQKENEQQRGFELEAQIEILNDEIKDKRKLMGKHGGVNAALDNSKTVAKQIRILENRLDKALQKFNEAIAENKNLREQIDTLRRERMVFDEIYKELDKQLVLRNREMAHIIEQANTAYEARDQAQAQMASLRQQADKEHQEFEKEWRELGRLIKSDMKMKEYMRSKVKAANEVKEATSSPKNDSHKKLTKHAWQTAQSMVSNSANQEEMHAYEESFAKIQAATGIDDIDKLVQCFVKAEDQNFSLFKYNNELSADIENLEAQILQYNAELESLRGASNGTSTRNDDNDKASLLISLEEKWNDVERKSMHYEIRQQEATALLSHLRTSIDQIFRRIDCNPDKLPSGSGVGISESNTMAYLAVIEDRTNELLRLHATTKTDDDDFSTPAPVRTLTTTSAHPPKLPSTVEDYSDDDEEEEDDELRPFTREEFKTRTLRSISRRQKRSRSAGIHQKV